MEAEETYWRAQVLRDLEGLAPDVFASRRLFSSTPYAFHGDWAAHIEWTHLLAQRLGVDPSEVIIVGSACLGISLSPTKGFRLFNADSDVDVAVISAFHFEASWRYMRNLGAKIYALPPAARESVKAHSSNYVYWGAVTADRILAHLPFGAPWLKALAHMATVRPTIGRDVNARIYRDIGALRSYQVRNIKSIQEQMLSSHTIKGDR